MDLKKLYNDPKFSASFTGKDRFSKAIKSRDRNIKTRDVLNALKSVDSYTLHKPVKKPLYIFVFSPRGLDIYIKLI